MTNNQESRLNMYSTVISFSSENGNTASRLPGFTSNLGKLDECTTQIHGTSEIQRRGTGGITRNKQQLKLNLVKAGADTSRKISAFATLNDRLTLFGEVNFSEYELKRASDIKLTEDCQIVYNKAQEFVTELTDYEINESSQAILLAAINSFKDTIPAPRLGATIKSQATKRLMTLFKTGNELLKKMDAAVEIIKLTAPNFYIGYQSARKVIIKGTSRLTVKGLVSDVLSGEPLKGVAVSFVPDNGTIKMASTTNGQQSVVITTARKGGFYIKSLDAGTYLVSFKKAGYADQTAIVNVIDGERTSVNVTMEKK